MPPCQSEDGIHANAHASSRLLLPQCQSEDGVHGNAKASSVVIASAILPQHQAGPPLAETLRVAGTAPAGWHHVGRHVAQWRPAREVAAMHMCGPNSRTCRCQLREVTPMRDNLRALLVFSTEHAIVCHHGVKVVLHGQAQP